MHLKHNIWFFRDALDKKWCNDYIKKYKNKSFKAARIGGDGSKLKASQNKKKRNSCVSFITGKEPYKKINPYLDLANKNAGWNFEVSWNENMQFTRYKKGQYYGWHMDMWHKPYINHRHPQYEGKIRKISCSVLLNDPNEYSGGDLEIGYTNNFETSIEKNKFNLKQCNLGQGSIIFFPGFIWHRVTPVTKGTRYSLVMWTIGKPYV
tara:strand:+ start:307 stop:927 length:621 start_codon:yes stop_codon:yes gene_type:complete